MKENINSPVSHEKDFNSEECINSISSIANTLDLDTIALLVGDDDWEIAEFEPKLHMSLINPKYPVKPEDLQKTLDLLTEIKRVELSDDPMKKKKLTQLAKEFNGE